MNGVVDETVDELWLFEELFGDKALVPFGEPALFFVLVGSPSAKTQMEPMLCHQIFLQTATICQRFHQCKHNV